MSIRDGNRWDGLSKSLVIYGSLRFDFVAVSASPLVRVRGVGNRFRRILGPDGINALRLYRTAASWARNLWVARNKVFLMVPSLVFKMPATVRSLRPW